MMAQLYEGYPGRAENVWYKYKYDTDKFKRISFFDLFRIASHPATGSIIPQEHLHLPARVSRYIMVVRHSDKELNKNFEMINIYG